MSTEFLSETGTREPQEITMHQNQNISERAAAAKIAGETSVDKGFDIVYYPTLILRGLLSWIEK